jgi:hypothetical protein
MGQRLAQKVLLIGRDGADWKLVNPFMDQGLTPALERVADSGVIGDLAALQPVLSPLLWNSISTGKRADKDRRPAVVWNSSRTACGPPARTTRAGISNGSPPSAWRGKRSASRRPKARW